MMHKNRIVKSVLTLGLIFVLAYNSVNLLASGSISNLKNKQEDVEEKIEDTQDKLDETKSQKSQTMKDIETLDDQLEKITDEYFDITDKLTKTEELLQKTSLELETARQKRESQYEALKDRLRFMQENGTMSYIEILFQSKNFSDFLNSMEYINSIVEYDNTLVERLQATENLIVQKLDEAETQKAEISLLADKLAVKKAALEENIAEKQRIVEELTQTEQQYKDQMESLEADSKAIEKMIKAAEEAAKKKAAASKGSGSTSSKPSYNGKMGWPVSGYSDITSHYGTRVHPVYKTVKSHTGVDIGAPTGASILAAESGTVIASQKMSGYGYTVIIDHGNGVSTLYGHNSKLLVRVGDTVKRGQVIAKCGSTGVATGPHCHFEVRLNGAPVNPKSYLGY